MASEQSGNPGGNDNDPAGEAGPPRAEAELPYGADELPYAQTERPARQSSPARGANPPALGSAPPRAGSAPPRFESAPPRAGSAPRLASAPPPPPPPPDGMPAQGKGARVATWAKRVGIALAALLALAAATVVLVIRHYEADLPSTHELKNYRPPQVTRILARDGTRLGEIFTERRTVVRLEEIPSQMKLAALAAEDAGFYEHAGLNYLGMLRALAVNLRSTQTRQGASTITQQVIKNVLLTPDRTFDRKMREIILARRIEQELTKDEILELYLNKIYFGHGRYGVEEASRYYFGKSVRDVTLAEAAMLAAVVKGPRYSPRVNLERATARRALVLDQMLRKGFADEVQVEQAKREPVVLAIETESLAELAPEAVAEAQRVLRRLVGPAAQQGGYTITTTIDPALQAAARAAVRKNLDAYAKRHKLLGPLAKGRKEPPPFEGTPAGHKVFRGVVTGADDARGTLSVRVGTLDGTVALRGAQRYNPKGLAPSKFADVDKVVRVSLLRPPPEPAADAPSPGEEDDEDAAEAKRAASAKPEAPVPLRLEIGPEGALVAIDVRTREIVALVGSYEAVRGGLDRATFARRQPGSTFKALVYGYGIHARTLTPATLLDTNPQAIDGYKPQNHDEREGKSPARLREAVAHSVNVAAVSALSRVGASNVVAFASALGIQSKLGADLSLALGAYEVTPREMAAAYASIAAGGVHEQPVLITKIVGPDGAEIPLPPRPPAHRVMEEPEAYVLTSLLTSVVQRGTAKAARSLGRPIAGKTGTTNQAKDAWFVGYSTDIACAVWTGYDDAAPLGRGEAGATAALPAFVDFMKQAHAERPVADFPVPSGVVRVKIDPQTGLLAREGQEDAIEEVFVAGTEPSEEAPVPEADAGAEGAGGGTPGELEGVLPAPGEGLPPAEPGMSPAPAEPGTSPAPAEPEHAPEPGPLPVGEPEPPPF
ncbi:penicillin-binding protein [Sorangium cellulosum]|uniref:Penicillin-binding protein n=1 Tax=Sorangium cellulosum TaxID=56 RepID=A0A4P2PSU5_SORCE|nr:PBP1A family penicillin-binding protein [Sorangium cellulosum]AUX19588.1 penicillin-binding protein [Sorangium cellulosum]